MCLGLSPSPVSLLFRTAFASFSFCRLAECSRFLHVFCFLASLRLIVSWFIIMFLSFCFSFPYPFLFGAVYLVVMHAMFLRQRIFRTFAVYLFH